MAALAKPGQGRGEHLVALPLQQVGRRAASTSRRARRRAQGRRFLPFRSPDCAIHQLGLQQAAKKPVYRLKCSTDITFNERHRHSARGGPWMFSKRSTRALPADFLDKPVDLAVVRKLIEGAARAASNSNVQPWNVYAVTGEPLQEVKRRVAEAIAQSDWRTHEAEFPDLPDKPWEPYASRTSGFGAQLYGAMGISRDNRAERLEQIKRNYRFFNAPVGCSSPSTAIAATPNGPTSAAISTRWRFWRAATGSTPVRRFCGAGSTGSCGRSCNSRPSRSCSAAWAWATATAAIRSTASGPSGRSSVSSASSMVLIEPVCPGCECAVEN